MSALHTLVVTEDDDDLRFEIECPGPDEWCREWTPCRVGEHDDDAMWDEDGDMHGVHHERLAGDWMVPAEPPRCWVRNCLDLAEVAAEIVDAPGRYPVRHGIEDDEFLTLELVSEPAEATR